MRDEARHRDRLLEQFEDFLGQLGIQIEVDEDEDAIQSNAQAPETGSPAARALQDVSNIPSPKLPRRASFVSMQDANDSFSRSNLDPRPELPLRSRSEENMAHLHPQKKTQASSALPRSLNVKKSQPNQHAAPPPNYRLKEDETEAESDIETTSESYASDVLKNDEQLTKNISEALQKPTPDVVLQRNKASRSRADYDVLARNLRFHHLAVLSCQAFYQWRDRVPRIQTQREQIARLAIAQDHTTLKHQALDQWLCSYRQRKLKKENEAFFGELEMEATKARDQFLLAKAFSHWAQSASEEVARTSAARRHILRIRYFKAWRDVTVVNAAKVRRAGLAKFFGIWKKRYLLDNVLERHAFHFNQLRLLGENYRHWFWTFCDRRAPGRYNKNLRARIFEHWDSLAHSARYRTKWSTRFAQFKLFSKCVALWKAKSNFVQQCEDHAQGFHRQKLLLSAIDSLQRELNLARIHNVFAKNLNIGAFRMALAAWRDKKDSASEATNINDLRIMRNGWTVWNDKLRMKAVAQTMNTRICAEALYRWMLAERGRLCERIAREKLMERIFKRWHDKSDRRCSAMGRAYHSSFRNKRNAVMQGVISKWSSASRSRLQDEHSAESFWATHQSERIVNHWQERARHVSELNRWANDGQFFVLTSTPFKRWREAVIAKERMRRRDAYTVVRRRVKIASALRALTKWRACCSHLASMKTKAVEVDEARIMTFGTDIFDTWRDRTRILDHYSSTALQFSNQRTIRSCFITMYQRYQHIEFQIGEARSFYWEYSSLIAEGTFDKLSWQLFQVRNLEKAADSLETRIRRKHYRKIVRHWLEKTGQRRELGRSTLGTQKRPHFRAKSSISPSRRGYDRESELQDDGSIAGLESGLHVPPSSMAARTPGYLKTPLRRRQATAMETPRLPPLTPHMTRITPFLKRLGAEYSRSRPTRSLLEDHHEK